MICFFLFFFLPLPSQANARSALSHGDPDPVRFRWLIPFSALQVRLGNPAGKSRTHGNIISSEALDENIR